MKKQTVEEIEKQAIKKSTSKAGHASWDKLTKEEQDIRIQRIQTARQKSRLAKLEMNKLQNAWHNTRLVIK